MTLKTRLLTYLVVLTIPILSGIVYGGWFEVLPFIGLVVLLAGGIEIIYRIKGWK